MIRRLAGLLVATVALLAATALLAPAAGAAMKFYKVTSATGTFDQSTSYHPPCESPGVETEDHADFALRKTRKGAGGMLVNNVGALIIPLRGGYDGVHRAFNCEGAMTSSCERKYFYKDRGGFLSIAFGAGRKVTASVAQNRPETSCPVPLANAIYVGETRVTRAQLRRRSFTLRFNATEELKASDGTVIGSSVARLTVKVRRTVT